MRLRDELKQGTRDAHERLENRLALDAPDLSPERYACYLAGMLAFHRSIAPPLAHAGRMWPGVPDCAIRIGWLEADLKYLGVEPRRGASPHRLPAMPGLPEVIGCSYVVQGASLGGHVLHGQLRERWGLQRERGGSFLFGYGPGTAARWKKFVGTMNAAILDEEAVRRCTNAARRTFCALDAWFEQDGWKIASAGDRHPKENPASRRAVEADS